MKKLLLLFAFLPAGLITAGCGTLTVGGHPVVGVESEKDKDGKAVPAFGTVITVHQYGVGGQVQPPPAPPGTPPTPPVAVAAATPMTPMAGVVIPPKPSYPTVYKSAWDDPTLVVIRNDSSSFVRIKIDGSKEEIRLAPYQATVDLHLDVGEHRLRITVERPTAVFGTKTVERIQNIVIRPDSRSQIVSVYSY